LYPDNYRDRKNRGFNFLKSAFVLLLTVRCVALLYVLFAIERRRFVYLSP